MGKGVLKIYCAVEIQEKMVRLKMFAHRKGIINIDSIEY